ncbi:FUSC family protein [Rhizobium sp. CB3090]|uniref:FUSC family protein n=1 Tax=Rhizobium sp. CB3090 TaxID=3039156 RepID=UPI0024B10197|nr:FUSC family protein [Rhizobium sp. CB3090]WFU08348.1 FUSC family protein [Rhizobium sp. CB3090]
MRDEAPDETNIESRAPERLAQVDALGSIPAYKNMVSWIDRIDPGVHRRIKGLRLVTAYGIAALLGTLHDLTNLAGAASISVLAGGIALWASVSEARTSRFESSRDIALLTTFATIGALVMAVSAPVLNRGGLPGVELILASGAFLVGYLKRFGVLGGGIGSQIYIGQLLTYSIGLTASDVKAILVAGLIATVAAIVPRLLSGPAERPVLPPTIAMPKSAEYGWCSPELMTGLQAAIAAIVIVAMNDTFGLEESAWAITACTYTVTNSFTGTVERTRGRLIGTMIGVPLGLAWLPIAADVQILIWIMAAISVIIYAMALPERYDVACAAFAFALVVTLAASGEYSAWVLAARMWETFIGAVVGLASAILLLPVRKRYFEG